MHRHVWVLFGILALGCSLPCSAQVLKGSKPPVEKPPNGNRLLLPSSGFSGGILTGVVIGPDNNPVPNAPVTINGGVLMGEVIGDPIKKDEKQPSTSGGPWIRRGEGSFGPEYGQPGSFTDWQKMAQDLCTQGAHQVSNPGAPGAPATDNSGRQETRGAGNISINWGDRTGGTAASPQWGGLTNAAGGFLVCVPQDAKDVRVSLPGDAGGGSAVSILIGLNQPGVTQLSAPPSFCSPGQRFDLNGAFPRASYEQGGQAGEMPVAMALSGDGKSALTTLECSNNLHPGPVKLSITDGTSHVREYQTHVFQFIDGALDQTQLMGGQPADFWYEIQMGPEEAGKSLCVAVTVAGPVVLTQPPAHKVTLNGDGRARVSGKIRATHVAPGSTIPFVIHPNFSECGE
jgi:hypothetical protein